MNRVRVVLLALLFLTPPSVLIGFGSYYLWEHDRLWVWWPLLACFGIAYFLSVHWPGVFPSE